MEIGGLMGCSWAYDSLAQFVLRPDSHRNNICLMPLGILCSQVLCYSFIYWVSIVLF